MGPASFGRALENDVAMNHHEHVVGCLESDGDVLFDEDLHMDPEGLADVLAIQADVQSSWERR